MAFALGKALMARDVSKERKSLRDEERRLGKEAEEQAEQMKKKGMWGSIGKTLGSVAVGAALAPVMGPGALMAAKMAGSYLGGRLGQGAVKASAKDLKYQGEGGNFLSSERQDLKDYASDLRSDFKDAQSGMRKGLAISSIKDPLMNFAAGQGLSGVKGLGSADAWKIGKGAGAGWEDTGPLLKGSGVFNPTTGEEFMGQVFDPATGMPARNMQYTGGSIWDRIAGQDEFSPFMSKKD